jgi:hypothetical protein
MLKFQHLLTKDGGLWKEEPGVAVSAFSRLEQESRRERQKEARGGFRRDRDRDTGDEGRALENESLAPVERNEGRGGSGEAGARERREVPIGSVTRDGIKVSGSRDGVAIEHAEPDPEGKI